MNEGKTRLQYQREKVGSCSDRKAKQDGGGATFVRQSRKNNNRMYENRQTQTSPIELYHERRTAKPRLHQNEGMKKQIERHARTKKTTTILFSKQLGPIKQLGGPAKPTSKSESKCAVWQKQCLFWPHFYWEPGFTT